jgi:cation transport regulator ChaB
MPYKQITQLPDNVKNNLPKHAQAPTGNAMRAKLR